MPNKNRKPLTGAARAGGQPAHLLGDDDVERLIASRPIGDDDSSDDEEGDRDHPGE